MPRGSCRSGREGDGLCRVRARDHWGVVGNARCWAVANELEKPCSVLCEGRGVGGGGGVCGRVVRVRGGMYGKCWEVPGGW